MSKQVVGSMSEWSGVLKDFFRQIDDGSITLAMIQSFLERRDSSVDSILADWQNFYLAEFVIALDTASIRVPERRKGFDRLVVVVGLTIQQVYDKCLSLFPCWKYTDRDLDTEVLINDRDTKNGAYAVWLRDRVEADEELKNRSANDLDVAGTPGITLLERLLFELKYFRETGKHLDIKNWTLCAGSRDSDGFVPSVHWLGGELRVDWCHSSHAYVDLRSREVVSI